LQDRSLATGSPRAHPMRTFAQSALVDKHYGAALSAGFFLSPATALSSTAGWPVHPAGWLVRSVAGNSSPKNARCARRDPDGTLALSGVG
jgi:hypothetical protein